MTQVCHDLHAEELGFLVSPFELIKEPANGGHPYPELPDLSPDPGQNQISFQVLVVVRDVSVVDCDLLSLLFMVLVMPRSIHHLI